jgi:hypothetical protein
MLIIEPLDPYTGIIQRKFEGQSARDLHKKLSEVALPKLGRQIIASFRTPGGIDRLIQRQEHSFAPRCMILDPKGALWSSLRSELFQVLAEAPSNPAVQANAYELLHWIVLARGGHAPGDARAMQAIFSDQSLFDAVWNAATATQLAPYAVYRLLDLPGIVQSWGITCKLPNWWQATANSFYVKRPEQDKVEGGPSEQEAR